MKILCLALTMSVMAGAATVPKQVRSRPDRSFKDDYSLRNEVTFNSNGDCTILGQDLWELDCRWILHSDYDRLFDDYVLNARPRQQVVLYPNGDCVIEGDMVFVMDSCRRRLGAREYDRLWKDKFGLPNIKVDDEGYCYMGDIELAPDDCPVFIGYVPYIVLLSRKTYSQ
ncbi:uncharacterized protein LOC124133784 [Haliotis rufescens]|uniref:uncharacterized protein LOC124133784 n=1 Tax=Haliotis rufescens TaxID=6454 RepID=UPI001EB08A0C|nr:uncharacterized protein LOC124133784 [Haliotis rufescens]